jgi:hypothetical protein
MGARGRWDWLYELVGRRQHRHERDESARADALEDALTRLGLSASAVSEGVASVLGLSTSAFESPDARAVRRTDPDQLAVLLPLLLHHHLDELRTIGRRWLSAPTFVYQIDPAVLVRWLESDATIADTLAERLRDEGLAILGPGRVEQLARTGQPSIRAAARTWSHRLRD